MNTVANFRPSLYGHEVKQHVVKPGSTIQDWLEQSGYWDLIQQDPIVVILNGRELMEVQYNTIIKDGDIIELQQFPRAPAVIYWLTVVYYAVVIIAAISLLTMDEPGLPEAADVKEGSPTYSLSAKGNRYRPKNKGPILYGTLRVVPDFDQPPFSTYDVSNDQTLHMLFRITQGIAEVNLTSILFEDTPISNFSGVNLEVVTPGNAPTLFPSGVVQSNDVNNVDLTGGFTTAYVVNDIGTKVSKIAIDMSSPFLGVQDKATGDISVFTVEFNVWAQELNDAGATVGGWVLLGKSYLSGWTRDPLRRTYEFSVTPKRYQVRLERITATSDSQFVGDTLTWATLKGYLYDPTNISTCTRLAISIRASEQIGNRALSDMSVICSRRLPTWNSVSGWSTPTLTNSIGWALADLCRNAYAGNRSDLNYDLVKLAELDAQLTPIGHEFNAYFDTEGTSIWDALIKAGMPGRITPIDKSGFYTFVRDESQAVPVQAFTMRNMARGTFRIEHSGVLEETADAIIVRFQDKDNDYRIRELLCALPDSSANNPRKVDMFGVTNATRAKELGMFMAACNRYRRRMTPFETGIEGRIPFYGSKIAISHYLIGAEGSPQVSGDITAFDGVNKIKVSEPIIAGDFSDPYIVMVDLDGKPMDPCPVTIINENLLQVGGTPDWTQIRLDPNYKRPMFIVGDGNNYVVESKVTRVERDGNVVRVTAFIDDPRPYTYGDGVIPPDPVVIPNPQAAAPILSELKANVTGTTTKPVVNLNWSLKNADKTDIQYSVDGGINFIPIGVGFTLDNKLSHRPLPGTLIYRLAAVNLFRGPWISITVDTNDSAFAVPSNPTALSLRETFNGPTLKVQWLSDSYKHYIEVRVAGVTKYTTTVEGLTWDYAGQLAQDFAVGRSFTVRVYAVGDNGKTSTGYTELAVANPAPAQLNNLTVTPFLGVASITFDWPTDTDIVGISVWKSNSNGFVPGAGNLNVDRSRDPVLKVPVGEAEVAYLRVAAVDNWGGSGLNISGQFTVTGKSVDTAAIQAQLDALAITLAAAQVDIDNAEAAILTAQGQISTLNTNLGTTNATLAATNATLATTNSTLAAATASISTLQGKFPIATVDISANAITAPKIAANAVEADKILANAVTTDKLDALAVTAAKIAALAVTTSKLDALAVTAAKIAALAIETDKIAANAVTADKIIALAIQTSHLSALAVTIDKLAVNSVDASKIVANSITADRIQALSLTAAQIAANTITANKLSISQLSAITADLGLVTAGTLQTTSGTTPRVVISSSGSFPLWIGNGSLVNTANGILYMDTSGNMVFKGSLAVKSATSGARLEINNDNIRVYDAAGTLRVKLGNLA